MGNSNQCENGNNITLDESGLFCGGIKDKELIVAARKQPIKVSHVFGLLYDTGNKRLGITQQQRLQLLSDIAESGDNSDV